ncbi:proline-specific peptidase [Candidatus Magnetobacterium bavaricum]|uniref:Proline-specific peptidase n=1 Tax=Candidatus Magnetobacterium bavaricum TaxID=29290 RepID=A0A0F3GPD9_9BACT|nr:proline-specific peptidase [Candidatus Magnetobacterium bavaricum]
MAQEILVDVKNRNTDEGYINLPDGKVWYKICGRDRKERPLVVVHGGGGFSHDYLEPLEELSDQRPVIFYDQHCCGNSERKEDTTNWTLEYLGIEFEQVLKALNFSSYHIFAHSLGASFVVSHLLNTKVDGIVSLVLASPNLSFPRLVADVSRCISLLPQSVRDILKKEQPPDKFDEAPMTFYRSFFCRTDPWPDCLNRSFEKFNIDMFDYMFGAGLFHITGTLKDFDITDRLDAISLPTLLTCGFYDEITPETVRYYHGKIRDSEIAIFSWSSHMPHLEQKDEYMDCIREFLNRHDTNLKAD